MQKINCITIEDKKIDQEYLESIIRNHDLLELKASFSNPVGAGDFINQYQPRLIFMDIDMPVMNGLDFFKHLSPKPICIFVTAYSDYALESYEAHAFDFLLKPVKIERFNNSIQRLKEYLSLLTRADLYESYINENTVLIKEGTTKHIINLNDIIYIEALKDYSKIVTANKKIMTLSKLKNLIEKLPVNQFARIHRSYAVALHKIDRVTVNDVYIQNIKLPIGRAFKENLKNIL